MKKYRIKFDEDRTKPYRVQRKGFIFWKEVICSDSFDGAKAGLIEHINRPSPKNGEVLLTYDSKDLLADKLAGKVV